MEQTGPMEPDAQHTQNGEPLVWPLSASRRNLGKALDLGCSREVAEIVQKRIGCRLHRRRHKAWRRYAFELRSASWKKREQTGIQRRDDYINVWSCVNV